MLLSLTVHEAAHAWTADRLGDPTARLLGRVSLNPLVHIDPIGTVLLPLIAAVSNFPIIGWAKPVPVNISRLGHPRRDFMLVAAAGPVSNLVLAVIAAVSFGRAGPGSPRATADFVECSVWLPTINVFLAVFNMVPVPPLDGGNVLAGCCRRRRRPVRQAPALRVHPPLRADVHGDAQRMITRRRAFSCEACSFCETSRCLRHAPDR